MFGDQKNLNYARGCQNPFGSYVEASSTTDNTPRGHIRDAICLKPSPDSLQVGPVVMALGTAAKISCQTVTKLTATDLVIASVEGWPIEVGLPILNLPVVLVYKCMLTTGLEAWTVPGADGHANDADSNNHGNDEHRDHSNEAPFIPDPDEKAPRREAQNKQRTQSHCACIKKSSEPGCSPAEESDNSSDDDK